MDDDARTVSVKRMCHVFQAFGMKDLRLHSPVGCPDHVYFLQHEAHLPEPVNGFFVFEGKERMNVNLRTYVRMEMRIRGWDGIVERANINVEKTVQSYVSLGNGLRTSSELVGNGKTEYQQARQAYEKAIALSFDESAIDIMARINAKPDTLTLSSTNDIDTSLVPDALRALVAEAFCGLAMIALHEQSHALCIGFAMIATFKHEDVALPMVNGVRVMAAAKMKRADDDADNHRTIVEALTSIVLLSAFKRSRVSSIQALYDAEMACWNEDSRVEFESISGRVVDRATSLFDRFSSQKSVIRSRFSPNTGDFVEKVCPVCGRGIAGEKLKRCAGCKRVFYCSKECQLAGWKGGHKAICLK